jgi:hypothetical protein
VLELGGELVDQLGEIEASARDAPGVACSEVHQGVVEEIARPAEPALHDVDGAGAGGSAATSRAHASSA